jgi:hypothetical protein
MRRYHTQGDVPRLHLTKIYRGRTGFPTSLSTSLGAKELHGDRLFRRAGTDFTKAVVTWIKCDTGRDIAQPVIIGVKKSSKKAPAVVADARLVVFLKDAKGLDHELRKWGMNPIRETSAGVTCVEEAFVWLSRRSRKMSCPPRQVPSIGRG